MINVGFALQEIVGCLGWEHPFVTIVREVMSLEEVASLRSQYQGIPARLLIDTYSLVKEMWQI